jgi:transposase
MGMFIDGDGIPMAFSVFSGNENEQGSLKPLEQKIIKDFDKAKFIVCTDAGLSGMANRRFNSIHNRSFITAQSIKKMKDFQKKWALASHGWHIVGDKRVYNLDEILTDEVLYAKYHDATFYKETWWNEDGLEQRYIVTYSIKYMEYLRNIREKQLQRAQKKLERGDVGRKGQNDPERFYEQLYFTMDGEIAGESATVIDMEKIRNEEQYDGFYCVATDLEDDAALILKANARRWEIEESFRIMKTDFRSRPVYLQRDDRIAAHFLTCFLALFVYRVLEKRLNERFTTTEILKTLREYKLYRIEGEGWLPCYKRTKITDALHEAFGFRTDYQINTNSMMKKIFHSTKI